MGVGASRSPKGGAHVARLGDVERRVLTGVVDEVIDLLGGDEVASDAWAWLRVEPEPIEAPTDSALRRLLPDVSTDEALAVEFRRLTEGDLRASKVANLKRLRAALASARPELVVAVDDASAVAAALTDVRLVLADRLGVLTGADDGDGPSASPVAGREFTATVYGVFGVLQESLVDWMLDALPDDAPGRRRGPR